MQLIFSPDERYSCTLCGECCTDRLANVSEDEVAQLEAAVERLDNAKRENYTPIAHVVNDVLVLKHNENSQCQFLTDNACQVHGELGQEVLPSICQLYPFVIIGTPGGVFVSTSFCCPAALAGVGSEVESHAPRLKKLLSAQPVPAKICGDEIALTNAQTVSWEDYLVWEETFLKNLDRPNIIKSLNQAIQSLHFPFDESQPQLSENIGEQVEQVVIQLSELALTFCEFPDCPESRAQLSLDLSERPGSRTSKNLDCKLNQVELYDSSMESLALNQFLHRWIRNHVLGKQLLGSGNVFCKLLTLNCAANLILYYYQQTKPKNEPFYFSFEILRACFKTVLTSFLNNTDLLLGVLSEYEKSLLKLWQLELKWAESDSV